MAFTPMQNAELMSVLDQWIRKARRITDVDPAELSRKLRERFPTLAESNSARDFRTAVNRAIRLATDARAIERNPRLRIDPRGINPAIPAFGERYVYRVVVTITDDDGKELASQAVWIRSDTPMTRAELLSEAISSASWQVKPDYRNALARHGGTFNYKAYVVSAGVRPD